MGVPYAEVIGDPIAHSKSPLIHNFWLEKLGLDYEFRLNCVRAEQLGSYLEERRHDPDWCGCSVTLPHKQSVLANLDELAPAARRLGAVNCITRRGASESRLVGHNSDWAGFLEPLRPFLASRQAYRMAQVIGSGGAAAAISYALDREGFTIVSINRNADKALQLRHRLELFDDDLIDDLGSLQAPVTADWGDRTKVLDLLVNATPLGMTGFPPLPVDVATLPNGCVVYDIVYDPLDTDLLQSARQLGHPTIDGLGMLIGQAAVAFESFFSEPAPREHDEELRGLLTS